MLPPSHATRSPGCTPRPARRWARRSARSAMAAYVHAARSPPSPLHDALAVREQAAGAAEEVERGEGDLHYSNHCPRCDEHLLQHRGLVGHDPVDAEVEQAVHLGGVVDGPHVHGQVHRGGRAATKRASAIGTRPCFTGSWAHAAPVRATSGPRGAEVAADAQARRVEPAEAGAQRRAERLAHPAAAGRRRTSRRRSGRSTPVRRIRSTSGSTAMSAFGSMLMRRSGRCVDELLERGRSAPCRRPGPSAPPTTAGRRSRPVPSVARSSVDVVEGDEHAVRGERARRSRRTGSRGGRRWRTPPSCSRGPRPHRP